MRSISITILLTIFSGLAISQANKGYGISFKIDGLSDSTVYLAYHLGDKQYLKDSVRLDKTGHCLFSGKESLPQGIYMIVLPGRKYFEMLISEKQIFSVTCNYQDYFKTLKFSGSDENSAFIDYQKKWVSMQDDANRIDSRIQSNKSNNDSIRVLSELRKTQEDKMKAYLTEVINKNKGSLIL